MGTAPVGLGLTTPPVHRRKGYRRQQLPDYGSGVRGFGAKSWRTADSQGTEVDLAQSQQSSPYSLASSSDTPERDTTQDLDYTK